MVPFVPNSLYDAAKWTLDVLDDWGERLAFLFGITSPKYAVEMRAHERSLRSDVVRASQQQQQFAGWQAPGSSSSSGASGTRITLSSHGYENPALKRETEVHP